MISKEEAKQIQADVMELGRKYSKDLGSTTGLAKGTMQKAVERIWETRYKRTHPDFKQWKKEVWNDLVERNTKASEKGNVTMTPKKRSFLSVYEEIALKHDFLPMDAVIAEQYNMDSKTPSKTRSALKGIGFEFAKIEGGWRVTKRPNPVEVPKVEAPRVEIPKKDTVVLTSLPQQFVQSTLLESTPDPTLQDIKNLLIHIGNKLDRQFELDQRVLNTLVTMSEAWQ